VNAIVALLSEDVGYSMPALAGVFTGRSAVRTFLAQPLRNRWRLGPAAAS